MNRTLRHLGALALLGALAACGQGAGGGSERVDHVAPPADLEAPDYEQYVALGDSYTAAPFVPETAANGCLRSSGNYPSLVAAELEGVELEDRSCSGADTTHLRQPQPILGGTVPPQLQPLSAETDLVTLGMGGNDFALFSTLVGECVRLRDVDPAGTPCADGLAAGMVADPLETAVAKIRPRLVAAVEEIERRAPEARILLVGYPQIIPESGTCPTLLPLAAGDYDYARGINEALADAVEQAAEDAGVDHVDAWEASEDRDICADEPWIAGAQTDPARALAFHPYAEHQRAVADLILDQL
ncbi:SGNH/GDSL hydrolase family protein [Nocardioides pacificus]